MRIILSVLSIFVILSNGFAQTPADHVKSVQEDPRVKAAFDHIDKDRDAILREWIAITEINAPSKQEQERAKYIESLLRKSKLDIRYDSAGNRTSMNDGLGSVSANGVRSRGIVLATRRGAPLVAPSSGTILFAGPFRDYDGVIIIDHGNGWKSVLVNAGTKLRRGVTVAIGEQLGIALGPVEIQLQHRGLAVSPALIAGSSAVLSNGSKGG